MAVYVALLRAVNVGGTGKLPMAELKAMCVDAGFSDVQTYIASGNVVFDAEATPAEVKQRLEGRLTTYAGKPVGVFVRTAAEIAAVLERNPFADAAPNRILAVFLDEPPSPDALGDARGLNDEQMQLGERELYVHYPGGMGKSKLVIPSVRQGTARNMNTVAKLVEMTRR